MRREKLNKIKLKYETSLARESIEKEELDKNKKHLESSLEAQALIQEIAKVVQTQGQEQISSIVSRCLEAVCDDPYEFRIVFEEKRGRTEARLVFCRDGLELDPTTESGLGVVDVAAFALRLSCLLLSRPTKRKLLVLDEPFKFISENVVGKVRDLLISLSEELQVQIIMVTHEKGLRAGKILELI